MKTVLVFAAAALAEIAGCFAVWRVLREGASPALLGLGFLSLAAFASLLTLAGTPVAGRAFAAYGGIYVVASLAWLFAMEGVRPDRWDILGGTVCLAGAAIILAGPRA